MLSEKAESLQYAFCKKEEEIGKWTDICTFLQKVTREIGYLQGETE